MLKKDQVERIQHPRIHFRKERRPAVYRRIPKGYKPLMIRLEDKILHGIHENGEVAGKECLAVEDEGIEKNADNQQ